MTQASTILNTAISLHEAGDIYAAERIYLDVIGLNYCVSDILPLVARIAMDKGDFEAAKTRWSQLLKLQPAHLVAQLELGNINFAEGDLAGAVEHYRNAVNIAPESPVALTNLAVALSRGQQLEDALAAFKKLRDVQPENPQVHHQIKRLTSVVVPFWHIPMMNDCRRNDAFEAAIMNAVSLHGNDAQILDIGSGSGLLSMFAARAGGKNIVTCEMVSTLAEVAIKIIDINGFSGQITVLNKPSSELEIGNDMPAKADILVSEILSSDLLAENVLGTFEDAHDRLLNKDATIIPRAASAIGCLVESEALSQYCFVDNVSGFDVSAFARLATQRLPVHGSMTDWTRLSADTEFVRIDLKQRRHEQTTKTIDIPVTQNGNCAGIVQWIKIDLMEEVEFENHPDEYSDGGWLQIFHPFPTPIPVKAGTTLKIIAGHDRSSLILMPAQALNREETECREAPSQIVKVA